MPIPINPDAEPDKFGVRKDRNMTRQQPSQHRERLLLSSSLVLLKLYERRSAYVSIQWEAIDGD